MSTLRYRVSQEILPFVTQPAQYIGGEINQLPVDGQWQNAAVRVAIAFPDAYSIGMSHLGCQILYWIVNHTPGCCAERVYCPWTDAETLMRHKHVELFTWDTRQAVSSADIVALSLQYEMGYSGVLQLLDLARIPLHSADRDDNHPLVIAGGPQADNPEPLAPFLDLVVLGDGEEAMSAILQAYKELKTSGVRRREMIVALARRFNWIYAPSLYDVKYNQDGTVQSVTPSHRGIPAVIRRCPAADLEHSPVPLRPLVPHVQVVHERIAIEIMRGCPQRCLFCHSGYTKRPLRRRSVDRILEIAELAYASTGMEELGLLSLSTADYPHLSELARRVDERFAKRRVSISVPSLRVDKMLRNIPWMVNTVRKSGLTMAVEAANDDMRSALRKHVVDGDLLEGVREAYKAGWRAIKLYFLCGLPGERPADIDGIVDLSCKVSDARRELGKGPAQVKVSVGWLVPKPFTPFQWAAQPDAEYFHETRRRLADLVRSGIRGRGRRGRPAVKIVTHSVERSVIEAVFARGDRRLAAAVEHAYKAGARFDGWSECFKPDIWKKAFDATGVDPAWYAHRARRRDEILPWSHLHAGSHSGYLQRQYDDFLARIGVPAPASSS